MKTKLVIFGVAGDLSRRKLLPALAKITETQAIPDLEIIGITRHHQVASELLPGVLLPITHLYNMELISIDAYRSLARLIMPGEHEQTVIYLSVPPAAASQITEFLGEVGVGGPRVKMLYEKPFGIDLSSATELIEATQKYFLEEQIYRIDHYLAKEMAQNIVSFRSENALFRHVWSRSAIESIDIVAYEKIGIEGRGEFYEQTGALRDVVQGHLIQLLALTIMELPTKFDWRDVPVYRLNALRSLHAADPTVSARGQYEGYQDEVANIGSTTETFVSTILHSDSPEWQGVPMRLSTGKALGEKTTEIRINFRQIKGSESNSLIFHIQPNEGVEIDVLAKVPGYNKEFETKKLSFYYPESIQLPDAYEQVLIDAIRSHRSIFTSGEEVIESWRVLQPLLDTWAMDGTAPAGYATGSMPDFQ